MHIRSLTLWLPLTASQVTCWCWPLTASIIRVRGWCCCSTLFNFSSAYSALCRERRLDPWTLSVSIVCSADNEIVWGAKLSSRIRGSHRVHASLPKCIALPLHCSKTKTSVRHESSKWLNVFIQCDANSMTVRLGRALWYLLMKNPIPRSAIAGPFGRCHWWSVLCPGLLELSASLFRRHARKVASQAVAVWHLLEAAKDPMSASKNRVQ